MFRYMKKISPVLSPMIAALFLFSSTISFVEAAQTNRIHQNIPYLLKSSTFQQSPNALFDDNVDTKYAARQAQLIERHFDQKVSLQQMRVYGAGDYQVNVSYKANGVWENTAAWKTLDLTENKKGWNSYTLEQPVLTDTLRVALIPLSSSPEGIAEISFDTPSGLHATNTLILDQGNQVASNLVYQAHQDTSDKTADMSFALNTAYAPNQIQRAVLSYEVSGVSGGASVIRSINDELAQGGLIFQPTALGQNKQVKVTEEINPEWLKTGLNKIKFFSHKGEMPDGYRISNVQLTVTTATSEVSKKPRLIAYAPQKSLSYKEYAYIRGFVQTAGEELSKIIVDGKEVVHNFGAFEALVKARGAQEIKVVATLKNGKKLTQNIAVDTTLSQFQAKSVQISSSGVAFLQPSKAKTNAKVVYAKADAQTEVTLSDATLKIKKEALQTDRAIKVATLGQRELPELDQGMVNVTKENEGYRFLPHGIRFDTENNIQIAYDENKLPKGMNAKDVKTYFFDEETGRWMPLPKVANADGIVTSKTDHFTDMINAVIQTPDAPQAKAYGATQIKDLKVANPGAKINLIEAPKATAMGDAQLSYPIEIPAGRHGMAPQLGVSYSSGASNSWMGLGWNLSVPSIGIDTRWGVPRYNNENETETYTMGGQQLAPMAHRGAPVKRTAEKTFHPRVEGSFSKIIRHGTSPKNYWWEVTAKNGTKSFYGGTLSGGVDESAVLTNDKGDIAHWALAQTVDVYGNTVTYTYEKVQDTGIGNDSGKVPGYQLYIKNINYTGFDGDEGAYDVTFIRDRDLQEERRTDVSIDARLGFKRVTADLLRKVEVKFNDTTFRSYEFVYTKGAFEKTLLKEIKQYAGAEEAHFNTHSFEYFDEVRDENGTYIAYDKNSTDWVGEGTAPDTDDGTPAPGLPTPPTDGTTTVTVPEITPPDDALIDRVNVNIKGLVNALNHANENSRVQLDMEGILTHGDSLFHQSKENNGFERTQVAVTDGVQSTALAQTANDGVADIIYPANTDIAFDHVRVWKAPFDGVITIDAPVALLEDTSEARAAYEDADGVRVAIQHQENELWSARIGANDYSVNTPTGTENIAVNEGDKILFRVQTLQDSAYDIISWNPSVVYTEKEEATKDANNLPLYRYNASLDSLPSAKALEVPSKGDIRVTGEITKPVTTDDVTFSLVKFDAEDQHTVVWEQTYSAAESTSFIPDLSSVKVETSDKLLAVVQTKSNVDFKSIKWNPNVTYNKVEKSFVDRVILGQVDKASYEEELAPYYTAQHAVKNSFGWQAPTDTALKVEANVPDTFTDSGVVHFTVKSEGKLLAQQNITITQGVVAAYEPLNIEVEKGQRVYFEYHYSGNLSQTDAALWTPKVTSNGELITIDTLGLFEVPSNLNEIFYRGWEEYTYDAANTEVTDPIVTDNLQAISSNSAMTLAATLPGVVSDAAPANTSVNEANQNSSSQTASSTGDSIKQQSSTQSVEVPDTMSSQSSVSSSSSLPGKASALSGAVTSGDTFHKGGTFGLNDQHYENKSWTVGAKYGDTSSETTGTLRMVDIDGDSLPDQVMLIDGEVWYRKNLSVNGIENFASRKKIEDIKSFHHSSTESDNDGYELHGGAEIVSAFVGDTDSESNTMIDIYFSDVNGDGLIDIISNGVAYYNHLNESGIPTFTKTSQDTPNPIIEAGTVSQNGWIEPMSETERLNLEKRYPLHDTVRVWQAPESGTISISAPAKLIENTSLKREIYTLADGVRIAIQHKDSELWSSVIGATDYEEKIPQNVNAINVVKGDHIYFRVDSIYDGAYDQVAWSPVITYTDKLQSVDANGLLNYTFDARENFLVSGGEISMPLSGTVSIGGSFNKAPTSDDVILRILKVDSETGNDITVWEENTGQGAQSKNINFARNVQQGESYRFEIYADTNVDWAKVSWKPTLTYTQSSDNQQELFDEEGNPTVSLACPTTSGVYSDRVHPTTPWTAQETGTVSIKSLPGSTNLTADVVFSVKKVQTLLAKQTLHFENGLLVTPVEAHNLSVAEGEQLYIEYHTTDATLASQLKNNATVEITLNGTTEEIEAGLYAYAENYLFGPMYRNWGQFIYNANDGRSTLPIIESELKLDLQAFQGMDESSFGNGITDRNSLRTFVQNTYDPSKNIFVMMFPRGSLNRWEGEDRYSYLNAEVMSASRLGKDNFEESSPVPVNNVGTIRAINQKIKSSSSSFAAGGSFAGISGSLTDTDASSDTLTEFIDMNGDRYPDIVGKNQIQYTTMRGALESPTSVDINGTPSYSNSKTEGVTLGGSYTGSAIQSGGEDIIVANTTIHPAGGISGNFGTTEDKVSYALKDMNADGLPDRVYNAGENKGKVALNLGYSFADPEAWNFEAIQESRSKASGMNGSLGINYGSNSISAAFAGSTLENQHLFALNDINSDGLLDQVYLVGSKIYVRLNTGNGFASEVEWGSGNEDIVDNIYMNEGINKDKTATGTLCIPIGGVGPAAPFKACVNAGYSDTKGSNKDVKTLTDIDGDGYLDFLQSSSTNDLKVKSSTIGKTNLLKVVNRPLGAKITMDYARSGNTYENPHHKWVLSEVEVYDGHIGDGRDTMKQKFQYEEGLYDRYEREFYGFAWVTSADIDTAHNDIVYRKNVSHYINDNYYEKGLQDYSKVVDGTGKLYVERFNAYETIDIFSEEVLDDAQKQQDDHVTFSKLVQTQTLYYEGSEQAGQMTAVEYKYDEFGNVTTQLDLGEFSDATDDWSAYVTYSKNLEKHIVSVPDTIKIYDDTGKMLRDREATVNEYGAVTQVRVNTGSKTLVSDMEYDQYGNLVGITYPPNHKGQRYALRYTLDDTVHTYTTSMSDSFGYTATAEYDYRFGAQTSQRDINNQPIFTTLDEFGRIVTITGPLEADLGITTITHSYFPDASTPYALTQHYDEGRADTLDTVTFIDGLMRVIQTKKDAAIDEDKDGIALDGMSVSGHVKFDSFGRTVETYYPVSEGLGSKGAFNIGIDDIAPTRTEYDVLDRKIKTILPDGATLTNAYGFGTDRDGVTRFHTLSTDANGNQAESFKDVRERITAVLQHNPVAGQDDIWTSYSYNAVNELLRVKDDKGNLTQAIYDLAGRRTHINNPDTGWIESKYDDAGNVVAKITDNLRDQGAQISYVYDYNRLTNINYPNTTSNNVTYTYGNSPAELNAGRITKIVDASGERFFEYGKLGETTKETRTLFTYTATEPKTYVTQYRYDTWNRLRELTYPDGEVVTHSYDSGGKLSSLQGVKGDYSYDYLKAMTYDKFGQRVFTKYANDTTATYSYEPDRRRLSHLSTSNEARTFIDNTYSYDRMQNILGVSNAAAVPVDSPHFGGETAQSYSYDNLYQLTSAEGSWTTRQGHEHRYTLAMSYDTIGNIKAKNQNHERLPYEGDSWIEQKGTTYDWTYDHEAKQPHAPTKIGNRTFTYDLNGNQTGWENTQNATNRVIRWDEENRISTITDNGHTSYYVYDAGGERSLKRTAQGETFYVNPYFVIREGEVASKHFFAGSQRVATKMTKQESQTVHGKGGNDKPAKIIYEKEQYFYHPDHLGSSSFVTDEKGEVYEHLEYFPYGEAFAHEHSNTQVTPYRFTGKELDEVTGLYYYGARYYDPRTSVWQSPDPILGEYMSGQTNGGVFNPKNLSLFSYTYNNPVNLVDPDGNNPGPIYLDGPIEKVDYTYGNWLLDNTLIGAGNTVVNTINSFANAGLNALNAYGEAIEPHEAAIQSISSGVGPAGSMVGMAIVAPAKAANAFNKLVKSSKVVEKEIIVQTHTKTRQDAMSVVNELVDIGSNPVAHPGKFGWQKDKVTGYKSLDGSQGWRVDFDNDKGAHINWWNKKEKGAVLFNASENQVQQIIKNEIVKDMK